MAPGTAEALLLTLFDSAVAAAQPENTLPHYLPKTPKGRTVVVGAGKASAAMAVSFEKHWKGDYTGLVVVPHNATLPTQHIKLVEASHPVPDQAGVNASNQMLEMVSGLTEDDLVIVLISGGGSSLLSCPGGQLTLNDKQLINKALLASGAAIHEMNIVRKHLSKIKGGRLAAAASPAKVVTLAISDVPGDDPSTIASGPTVVDESTTAEAVSILQRYNIELPDAVKLFLESTDADTPDENDPRMQNLVTQLICTPQKSLEASASLASSHDITPVILGDSIEGEAREVGKVMAGMAKQALNHNQPVAAPVALISGGETTVTLRSKGGRGGRNAEFLLGFAENLGDSNRVFAIACDTDGIDGSEENAGVKWSPQIRNRMTAQKLKPADFLDRNDAWSFFNALDALVTTGPTHTNVNDFRAVLVLPEEY